MKLPEFLNSYDENLSEEATALGFYCIAYSRLEYTLNVLIEELLGCDDEIRRMIVEACGSRVEVRTELIRRLATKHVKDQDVVKALNNVLAFLKSKLSPVRNRLIHDFWPLDQSEEGGGRKGQIDDRIFRKKQQSRQSPSLTPGTFVPRPAKEIWFACRQVDTTWRLLWAPIIAIREIREKGTHSQRLISTLRDADPNDLLSNLPEEP